MIRQPFRNAIIAAVVLMVLLNVVLLGAAYLLVPTNGSEGDPLTFGTAFLGC